MARRPVDNTLRDWLAAQVPNLELRDLVRDEFPDLYSHLPGPGAPPSHFVHELFIGAAARGLLDPLAARVHVQWPDAPAGRRIQVQIASPDRSAMSRAGMLVVTLWSVFWGMSTPAIPPAATIIASGDMPEVKPVITRVIPPSIASIIPLPQTDTTRRHRPPESPAAIERELRGRLMPCALALQGVDLLVEIETDAQGVWRSAEAPWLSYSLLQCFVPALKRAVQSARRRRFTPDLSLTLLLRLGT